MTIIRFDLYEYPIELNDEFKNKNIVLAEGSSVKAYAVDPTDYQMSFRQVPRMARTRTGQGAVGLREIP